MKKAAYWVSRLNLDRHPEGGYYKETYRATDSYEFQGFEGERNLATGIYFLIESGNFSAFHRIKSDEMWHFYAGDSLTIHLLDKKGRYSKQALGLALEAGEVPQFVVPAGVWFASEVTNEQSYALVGCTVSPGFHFNDFELAGPELATLFPKHRKIIKVKAGRNCAPN
jgi:hypothetical protein